MKNKLLLAFVFLTLITSCIDQQIDKSNKLANKTKIIVLGTAQDAGSPQINCSKACCSERYKDESNTRKVTSLGLYDASTDKTYLFEATADIAQQTHDLQSFKSNNSIFIDGIFLTHAHIGHYSGLMYLGKEAMDAKTIPTYVMPRMDTFLSTNAPWNLLIDRNNIEIKTLQNGISINLSDSISVTPFLVPHRDEFSETVGYNIIGPKKSALFIPDIDKWSKWERNIVEEIKNVDYAFLDATFYDGAEINNRDISEIPHPFVSESIELFKELNSNDKNKIIFIHFNHTNPLLDKNSKAFEEVIFKGFKVARTGQEFDL